MEKVALFVDVQNIYYTTKKIHGCHFDYRAFWNMATTGRQVVKAVAYAIDRGDKTQMRFQEILRKIGFEVKLKPFTQRRDGSTKGDWDVGIALDMMDCAAIANILVLASGDGDFDVALDRVRARFGVNTEVYGVPGLTARSLINAASRFVPIQGQLLLRRAHQEPDPFR
ncbi:MAG: NYN domain-containing protein [Proteobacteria bacterium]|nr:NYN domain-containing protein [Pseudomonadota bacterium]